MARRVGARIGTLASVLGTSLVILALAGGVSPLEARRLALLVGVADYGEKSGLSDLNAPVHDVRAVRDVLQDRLRSRFETTLLTNKDVADRAQFNVALEAFLARIQPGDEVLFYFSGHGNYVPEAGNVFMLQDAKSQTAFIDSLPADEARALDTAQKRAERYQAWLADNAVREQDIEKSILARKPDVLVIIADACRTIIKRAKGAEIEIGGVRLPQKNARGTYRLYSASVGQISLDSPEPIPPRARDLERNEFENDDDDDDDDGGERKGGRKSRKKAKASKKVRRTNSLFTKVLVTQMLSPGVDFEVMAARVRVVVRDHARSIGQSQIPEFVGGIQNTGFAFSETGEADHRDEVCYTAPSELASMRVALAAGSLARKMLLDKRYELARCGPAIAEQIDTMLRLEALGSTALGAKAATQLPVFDRNDPAQLCEVYTTSPHDPNGRRDIPVDGLRVLSLRALSGEVSKAAILTELNQIKQACERILAERPRVARFNYQLARVFQTIATLSGGLDKQNALAFASAYFERAADRGYAAAFNDLALLYKAGEYHAVQNGAAVRMPPSREQAAELLKRGAGLNHTIAQYNLGMAYLSGDLGLRVSNSTNTVEDPAFRYAAAFEQLSRAAERGFVPALIETSRLLFWGHGVPENEDRAIELLEIAASKGSWDAMYWIGEWYRRRRSPDSSRAIIWYARAAEAGDARAQQQLASMLTDGTGLPATQREAAGRYWRLAALAGESEAQARLAKLIRDGIIPFRPVTKGQPDRGAREILSLLLSSFTRGNPEAGLELARLYRTGFPKDRPSEAIPNSNERAVRLLWETIEKVREADPSSAYADPTIEAKAAFELMAIHQVEAAETGRSSLITDDQIERLRRNYGDGTRTHLIRLGALGPIRCGGFSLSLSKHWLLVWNWQRKEPPTEVQFDWLERRYACRDIEKRLARKNGSKEPKDEYIGISRELRSTVKRIHDDALSEQKRKGGQGKLFVERMIDKVTNKPYGG